MQKALVMQLALMIAVVLSMFAQAYGVTAPPPAVCDGRHASLTPGVGLGPVKIGEEINSVLAVLHGYLDASGGRQDPDLVGWGYRDPSVVQPEPLVLIHHDRIVAVLLHIEMPEADKCFTRTRVCVFLYVEEIHAGRSSKASRLGLGVFGGAMWT